MDAEVANVDRKDDGSWPDEAVIETVIGFLDDPEDNRRVWQGLQFMELNGLDLALRYGELHAYLTGTQSPIDNADRLTLSQERALVLTLRERIRADLGMEPLEPNEKLSWCYDKIDSWTWREDKLVSKLVSEVHKPTEAEIVTMKAKLESDHPDLANAISVYENYHTEASRTGSSRQSTFWLAMRLVPIVAEMRPDLDAADVHGCVHALMGLA